LPECRNGLCSGCRRRSGGRPGHLAVRLGITSMSGPCRRITIYFQQRFPKNVHSITSPSFGSAYCNSSNTTQEVWLLSRNTEGICSSPQRMLARIRLRRRKSFEQVQQWRILILRSGLAEWHIMRYPTLPLDLTSGSTVLWNVIPFSLVARYLRFGRSCCIKLQV